MKLKTLDILVLLVVQMFDLVHEIVLEELMYSRIFNFKDCFGISLILVIKMSDAYHIWECFCMKMRKARIFTFGLP